jgi:hypothetical protein
MVELNKVRRVAEAEITLNTTLVEKQDPLVRDQRRICHAKTVRTVMTPEIHTYQCVIELLHSVEAWA